MKFKHFVSYVYRKNFEDYGYGNCEVNFAHFPPTIKDIRDAQDLLIKRYGYASCIIINYNELTVEEE